MGFDAMFFSRLDGDEKAKRQGTDKGMTFLWRPGQKDFGNQHQILTHVFSGDYCYPQGFFAGESFDSDDTFVSDDTLETFNAPDKMAQFVNYVQQQYSQRRGQNIMIPMGCDFAYQNAKEEFENVERAISYINTHNQANMQLRMSTPSEFIDALKSENIEWPVRYEDSIPYADSADDWWTGYFSSRPAAKQLLKDTSTLMSAESKLFSKQVVDSKTSSEEVNSILDAQKTMLEQISIGIHHDALTGTAKQHVANDYARRLFAAQQSSLKEYRKELQAILKDNTGIELN